MATVRREGNGRAELNARLAELRSQNAKVGWLATAKYPDKNATPVAYVAVIQEYGSPGEGIPPRPFMRLAFSTYFDGWGVLMAQGAKRVMQGKMSATAMYEAVGVQVAGDIRATLAGGGFQALAESTKRARAAKRRVDVEQVNADPLHDTGYMQASLTNTVGNQ